MKKRVRSSDDTQQIIKRFKVARNIFKDAVDTKVNPIDYLILIQSDAAQFLSVPADLRYDHAFKVDALKANHDVLALMTLQEQFSLINNDPRLLVFASAELFQTKEITDLLLVLINMKHYGITESTT